MIVEYPAVFTLAVSKELKMPPLLDMNNMFIFAPP